MPLLYYECQFHASISGSEAVYSRGIPLWVPWSNSIHDPVRPDMVGDQPTEYSRGIPLWALKFGELHTLVLNLGAWSLDRRQFLRPLFMIIRDVLKGVGNT